ncbi:alpha-ribazole phosphatase [Henriciella sp.]|uniref:alpha-ribazole phosphatase n=1 Tax=Henriciella sp. TaxID=1968823 RepID=UPI00262A76D7|nr:alpha-ribazole phosphatase [Henriciella sp.]
MAVSLLRHTTPLVAPGTCYGMTDLGLAESFAEEAENILSGLPPVEQIVTSPLTRCQQLADFMSKRLSVPVTTDCRLREMDFGTWEGRAWADIPRAEINAWVSDFMHARPHGGESVAMLRARTLEAIAELENRQQETLIVTHAGVIKAALAAAETAASHSAAIGFGCYVTLIPNRQGASHEHR